MSHDVSMVSRESLNLSAKMPKTKGMISPIVSGRSNKILQDLEEDEIPHLMKNDNIATIILSPPVSPRKKTYNNLSKVKAKPRPNSQKALLGDIFHSTSGILTKAALNARKSIQLMVSSYRRRKSYGMMQNLSDFHFEVIADLVGPSKQRSEAKWHHRKRNESFGGILMLFLLNVAYFFEYLGNNVSVFNPNSPLKIVWDLVIMIISFVRLFCFSLEKSFSADLDNEFFEAALIALLYLDFVFSTNTKIFTKGREVTDRVKILKHLFSTNALTEVVPVLAFSMVFFFGHLKYIHELQVFLLLKLPKAIEILKRIKEWLIHREKSESLYSLIILFFKILLWAHFFACMWHIVSRYSVDANDTDASNWIRKRGIENEGWSIKYLYSVYWSVTTMLTVGYGDITPVNSTEVFFNICTMFLGCGMFGYSMSRIAEILKIADRADRSLEEQMDKVSLMLRDKHLPMETQIKVKKYLEFVWKQEKKEDPENEKIIMSKLSSKLRDEIYYYTNVKCLKSVPVFRVFKDETLIRLAPYMKKIRVSPEEYLYREGEIDDPCLFFVLEGCLELIKESDNCSGKTRLNRFKKDDFFGLEETITGVPRRLGVISKGFSTLFKLNRRDIIRLLQRDPQEYEKFCMLRDLDIVYKIKEKYQIPCKSCNFLDHPVESCSYLKFRPVKFIIIGNHLFQKKKFAKEFKRKLFRTRNPLKQKNNLITAQSDFIEVYKEDSEVIELSKFYEELMARPEPHSPTKAEQNFVGSSEMEESKAPENLEENSIDVPGLGITKSCRIQKQLTSSSLRPLKSLQQKNSLSVTTISNSTRLDKPRFSSTVVTSSASASKSISGPSSKPKESPGARKKTQVLNEYLELDRMKSYKFYFPYNNVENVLKKLSESRSRKNFKSLPQFVPLK